MTPVFDPTRPYGDIMQGTSTAGVDPSQEPRYTQDGHYFKPNKSYCSSDPGKHKAQHLPGEPIAAAIAPAAVQTRAGIEESEVDELMKDPRAIELFELPRDDLIKLMRAANGPMYAGEGSSQLMVAWLVKNTDSGAPRRAAAPVVPALPPGIEAAAIVEPRKDLPRAQAMPPTDDL